MATMSLNIKYAVIFITILPILMVYPFVQKYFVKGVMVGQSRADYIERRIHNEKEHLKKQPALSMAVMMAAGSLVIPGTTAKAASEIDHSEGNHDHDDDH